MTTSAKSALDLAHEAIDRLCRNDAWVSVEEGGDHRKAKCDDCKAAHAALDEAILDACKRTFDSAIAAEGMLKHPNCGAPDAD